MHLGNALGVNVTEPEVPEKTLLLLCEMGDVKLLAGRGAGGARCVGGRDRGGSACRHREGGAPAKSRCSVGINVEQLPVHVQVEGLRQVPSPTSDVPSPAAGVPSPAVDVTSSEAEGDEGSVRREARKSAGKSTW